MKTRIIIKIKKKLLRKWIIHINKNINCFLGPLHYNQIFSCCLWFFLFPIRRSYLYTMNSWMVKNLNFQRSYLLSHWNYQFSVFVRKNVLKILKLNMNIFWSNFLLHEPYYLDYERWLLIWKFFFFFFFLIYLLSPGTKPT